MSKIIKIGFLFILAGSMLCKGQDPGKIESLVTNYYNHGYFNGSILVAQKGKILFKKGFGYANFEWKVRNTTDTKFRIGSLTKQFVSLLIMQLVADKKIELEKPITSYLPDYRKDIGDSIKIFHLLTHTSGLPDYTEMVGFWSDSVRNKYTKDYILNHFCSSDLGFKPGESFKYSNTGYFILGMIIEKVTGKSYNTVLEEKILNPLGMLNTGMDYPDSILSNRASGYIKIDGRLTNAAYIDIDNIFTAGGMYSTVDDLYLWDKALFGTAILSDSLKSIMFTPFKENYALGWGTKKYRLDNQKDSITVLTHSGSIRGFKSVFFHIINNESVVILMDNTYSKEKRNEICERILEILYNDKIK